MFGGFGDTFGNKDGVEEMFSDFLQAKAIVRCPHCEAKNKISLPKGKKFRCVKCKGVFSAKAYGENSALVSKA